MKEAEYNNMMIDYCQRCKGIWLDYGELETLVSNQRIIHSENPLPDAQKNGRTKNNKSVLCLDYMS